MPNPPDVERIREIREFHERNTDRAPASNMQMRADLLDALRYAVDVLAEQECADKQPPDWHACGTCPPCWAKGHALKDKPKDGSVYLTEKGNGL